MMDNILTYFPSYLLTQWSRVVPEKLTGSQLLKKFPAFYGTRRFITAFTNARHLSLSWVRPIQSMPPSHFLKIHFNFILPSTPRYFEWSLSIRSPHQSPVCTPYFLPYVLHNPHISFFSIWSPKQYMVKSTDEAPHYVVLSTLLLPSPSQAQIFCSASYSQNNPHPTFLPQ